VAHVGLHRANVHAIVAKNISNCACLCWVAYWRPGSVALGIIEVRKNFRSQVQSQTHLDESSFRRV
jgi:hypothetical protein